MHRSSFNKELSGYIMLSLLAEADGDYDAREGGIIVNYIKENFPQGSNFEDAIDFLAGVPQDKYEDELVHLAQDFYSQSTDEERTDFLRFAMKLVRADEQIAKEENMLITKLFEAWDV
jgi:uncharacterized tellurite resistance protein B-like protein